ncbi:3172_t:CDS:2 [Acaulospora morrowiae]|uniref:3172_t:CDS:1 n=1 Tax=Acaulospora morrowiae TaxID=94023 RepID=A0A9N9CRB2_9GLOM|nr:3172_t:CDS:2 [Acaulospora morrowiae]
MTSESGSAKPLERTGRIFDTQTLGTWNSIVSYRQPYYYAGPLGKSYGSPIKLQETQMWGPQIQLLPALGITVTRRSINKQARGHGTRPVHLLTNGSGADVHGCFEILNVQTLQFFELMMARIVCYQHGNITFAPDILIN